ncbi:hypothetical protein ZIOFF_059544 [Zingiber officinale]|uniref:Sm domain-containing protein n=1 Tax=Zingiber officinale TaxID=94328 RepID=A0A8J5F9W6_ZINOF|nr:hypothetical protein ZIOFF_059544 [Zingiber officinale]
MLFFSYFKELVGKEVTVELKNDLTIRGTLHSVDQYLNIKLVAPFLSLLFTSQVDAQRAQPIVVSKSSWWSVLQGLPHGIVESSSNLEFKSLWQSSSSDSKFLPRNCSIILFHYDGNTEGWCDLEWNDKALHIVTRNQTKWLHTVLAVDAYSNKIKHLLDAAEGQEASAALGVVGSSSTASISSTTPGSMASSRCRIWLVPLSCGTDLTLDLFLHFFPM